jgi:ubiquinone biosynthesis accessory factor UbiJ
VTDEHRPSEGFEIPAPLLAAAETALNRYIALDPEGARGFAPIYGRIVAIEIEGLGARVTLIPGPDRLQIFGAYDATPDCLIRGAPLALARMGMASRKESQLSSGEIHIEGDSTVAQRLAEAMAGLDVDWEEQLSKLVGDPIAHSVGEGLRAVGDWGQRTRESVRTNFKEYLQEESRLVPSRYEVLDFLARVDTLRDDVERMEARVERLASRVEAKGGDGAGQVHPGTGTAS